MKTAPRFSDLKMKIFFEKIGVELGKDSSEVFTKGFEKGLAKQFREALR
jgi:hypothetical protein